MSTPLAPTRAPARARAFVALLGLLVGAAAARPAALAGQAPTLDRVDSLIAAANYEAARSAIEAWWAEARPDRVAGAQQARALMLRAQLAGEPAAAEPHYLAIVFGYPIAPEAPRALLRLGQGLLVGGEPARAVGYLQRFVADYPGHPERAMGLLWLARAGSAGRQNAVACAAAREGLLDSRDPDLTAMFRAEEEVACALAGAATPARPEPAAAPVTPPPAAAAPRTADPPAVGAGRFAAQAGAYRQQQSVDDIMARLRRAGYQPRVVLVPGSSLLRVRVGRSAAHGDAARLVERLRSGGFDAVVVADADQEREP